MYVLWVTFEPFATGSKVMRRTVSVLHWIVRSGVDGRAIGITCDTDQEVIHSSLKGS